MEYESNRMKNYGCFYNILGITIAFGVSLLFGAYMIGTRCDNPEYRGVPAVEKQIPDREMPIKNKGIDEKI